MRIDEQTRQSTNQRLISNTSRRINKRVHTSSTSLSLSRPFLSSPLCCRDANVSEPCLDPPAVSPRYPPLRRYVLLNPFIVCPSTDHHTSSVHCTRHVTLRPAVLRVLAHRLCACASLSHLHSFPSSTYHLTVCLSIVVEHTSVVEDCGWRCSRPHPRPPGITNNAGKQMCI